MGRWGVFEWHKLFREGSERVEDDDRSGRPPTSKTNQNVLRVKSFENNDLKRSIRMIADKPRLGPSALFSVPKIKIDAQGEASRIGRGNSTSVTSELSSIPDQGLLKAYERGLLKRRLTQTPSSVLPLSRGAP
ncbi:hypothetical protein TNCV_2694901 [Trichonephila clavipes]|nr:hypothetical protein TNCV_2694901 [Trichonephila clavipes]